MSLFYVIMRRLEWTEDPTPQELLGLVQAVKHHLHIQICGDDARLLALTTEGSSIMDLHNGARAWLQVWEDELPWEVKVEGLAIFSEGMSLDEKFEKMPPMVSRNYVRVGNLVFDILVNVSRCLRKLCADMPRSQEEERVLVDSAASTLALHIHWTSQGEFYSPALEMYMREFPVSSALVRRRVCKLYANQVRQWMPAKSRGPVLARVEEFPLAGL
jgi:hypothetical protein